MIILYSITGIITALFLCIIIMGAVRAHRHPERYGPRRVAGRPRQSRARGIARAMLDTIPIVKFGDEADGVAAAKRDVELVGAEDDHARENSPRRSDSIVEIRETTPRESEMPATKQPHVGRPDPEPRSTTDAIPDGGNFSCPICTDDFIKGIASKSYLSGKPYLVKFADGRTQPTGDWLSTHLAKARKNKR